MDKWIPVIQVLIWPLFVIALLAWFRTPIRTVLRAVVARVEAGNPVKIGPIEFQALATYYAGQPASTEKPLASVSREVAATLRAHSVPEPETAAANAIRQGLSPLWEMWEDYTDSPAVIAISVLSQLTGEPSGVTGIGDALALGKIEAALATLGAPTPRVLLSSSQELVATPSRDPTVAVGGPLGNRVARHILSISGGSLGFDGLDIVDRSTGRAFVALLRPSLAEVVDYGLVVVTGDPRAGRTPARIFAGCYGFGTLAAALALTDRQVAAELMNRVGPREYEAVVAIRGESGRLGPPELVMARRLPSQ